MRAFASYWQADHTLPVQRDCTTLTHSLTLTAWLLQRRRGFSQICTPSVSHMTPFIQAGYAVSQSLASIEHCPFTVLCREREGQLIIWHLLAWATGNYITELKPIIIALTPPTPSSPPPPTHTHTPTKEKGETELFGLQQSPFSLFCHFVCL